MLDYLIVSGLCLLLLLHIVCKVWLTALEMHSAADNFDKARDLAARGHRAINDSQLNSSRRRWLESSPPKYCHVWLQSDGAADAAIAMQPSASVRRAPIDGLQPHSHHERRRSTVRP